MRGLPGQVRHCMVFALLYFVLASTLGLLFLTLIASTGKVFRIATLDKHQFSESSLQPVCYLTHSETTKSPAPLSTWFRVNRLIARGNHDERHSESIFTGIRVYQGHSDGVRFGGFGHKFAVTTSGSMSPDCQSVIAQDALTIRACRDEKGENI